MTGVKVPKTLECTDDSTVLMLRKLRSHVPMQCSSVGCALIVEET